MLPVFELAERAQNFNRDHPIMPIAQQAPEHLDSGQTLFVESLSRALRKCVEPMTVTLEQDACLVPPRIACCNIDPDKSLADSLYAFLSPSKLDTGAGAVLVTVTSPRIAPSV